MCPLLETRIFLRYNLCGDYMKILIVEDNNIILDGLKFSLERENFTVDVTTNIKDAQKEIISNIYSLAILDIMLPDGNGIELCKYIKERQDIPVIFLTAKDSEIDIIKGLNMGADDYIVKPFRIGELIARINNALRKYKKDTNIIKINNVIIDTEKMIIHKGENEVILTNLEWRILNTLLNSRGCIVTRDKLITLACDLKGNFINDNSLTVYIKRIREKIEDDINNPKIIKTIKGIGYKIENADFE